MEKTDLSNICYILNFERFECKDDQTCMQFQNFVSTQKDPTNIEILNAAVTFAKYAQHFLNRSYTMERIITNFHNNFNFDLLPLGNTKMFSILQKYWKHGQLLK